MISQEKPREINQLEKDYHSVQSLPLQGLDQTAIEIFKNQNLPQEQSLKIIELYHGHPQWLKAIADLNQELGNEEITTLFPDDSILLTEEIEDSLKQIFSRLSAGEKQIMIVLAKQDKPLTIMQLQAIVKLSQNELVNGVRSLQRRCLILEKEKYYYILNLIREFIKIVV